MQQMLDSCHASEVNNLFAMVTIKHVYHLQIATDTAMSVEETLWHVTKRQTNYLWHVGRWFNVKRTNKTCKNTPHFLIFGYIKSNNSSCLVSLFKTKFKLFGIPIIPKIQIVSIVTPLSLYKSAIIYDKQ